MAKRYTIHFTAVGNYKSKISLGCTWNNALGVRGFSVSKTNVMMVLINGKINVIR